MILDLSSQIMKMLSFAIISYGKMEDKSLRPCNPTLSPSKKCQLNPIQIGSDHRLITKERTTGSGHYGRVHDPIIRVEPQFDPVQIDANQI